MLAIVISSFFALSFFGACAVIVMMFAQYRDRIASVIQAELQSSRPEALFRSSDYRNRPVKAVQPVSQHRSLQPVPLRAAA